MNPSCRKIWVFISFGGQEDHAVLDLQVEELRRSFQMGYSLPMLIYKLADFDQQQITDMFADIGKFMDDCISARESPWKELNIEIKA